MSHPVQIPGIVVGEELGRGSYSVVYRARQGTRPCAVKIPIGRGRWTRWVYREAVALARVHHPGLAAVIEVSEIDDLPYLVMELVEGETLGDRLSRGGVAADAALNLMIQLASALGAIHAAGLVHRDVKPRNIILGKDGRLRLIDFGFASPIELAGRDGDRAGTRGYAAPEQFRANAQLDGRSDLYALGRVLAECLVGRTPRSIAPMHASLTLIQGADARFQPVLAGLLREDPGERYPDARALARDLEIMRAGGNALGPKAYEPERRATTLIGRTAEIERITRGWLAAGAKSGSVALVVGERGSGKSRVLDACVAKARDIGDRRVLDVSCLEGDPPLVTLRRILEAYAGSLSKQGRDERIAIEQAVRTAVGDRLAPFARLIAPGLSQLFGVGGRAPEAAPGGFPHAVAELLIRLARATGPLLLAVDDLQWVDPVSRETLMRLAERSNEAPVSLLLAARSIAIQTATFAPFVAMDRNKLSIVELPVLAAPEVASLVASHLGEPEPLPELVRRVESLSDGTPLGALEVLGVFLDCGALRPHAGGWKLDPTLAERVILPDRAAVLLGHRLQELPPATRRVLEAASIIGATFDESLLAQVVGLDVSDIGYALAEGRRAALLVSNGPSHRFVHDSLREMLAGEIDLYVRRKFHQRVAELFDDQGSPSFEAYCTSALHYAAGETTKNPAAGYRAARLAAAAALERFDNETALRFFGLARHASVAGAFTLDASFHRSEGEAYLRLGALTESRRSFESALADVVDAHTRASILGRIAWVHQARADPDRAWATLESAFESVDASTPSGSVASAAISIGHALRAAVGDRIATIDAIQPEKVAHLELMCNLHYQNARLGSEYGKPLRLVQSALEALKLSERLGSSRTRARALATYGFVLSALGRHGAGVRAINEAQRMAHDCADPMTQAFCVQTQAVADCFAGDLVSALGHLRECVEIHGPWLELNEYCLNAATADHIESVRGRCLEAMEWNARATDRQRRSQGAGTVSSRYILERARAAHAVVGRDVAASGVFTEDFAPRDAAAPSGSLYHTISWGPRARVLLEEGSLGETFEALVRGFESEKHNPRTAHLVVTEYYIVVAHARVNQCLRARRTERAGPLERLREALADLRAAAKLPLYKAHALFIEGCVAWLGGDSDDARRAFRDAESLAESEICPWVVSEVARMRAHMLLEEGKSAAGLDQARFAEMLARQCGAAPRAKRTRREFLLPEPAAILARPSSSRSSAQSSSHARRQLSALLNAVQKPSPDLKPAEQMAAVIDDLLRDVDAARGVLSFRPDADLSEALVVARSRRAAAAAPIERWHHAMMRRVHESGEPWPPESEVAGTGHGDVDPARVLVYPLFLYSRVVGAVCLERDARSPAFTFADRDLLLVLSHQVPVAIEVARLLAEREQLHAARLRSQKLEAVGQLAGAISHDFNNTLVVIRTALEALERELPADGSLKHDVQVISSATDRATRLTEQLLSFSSHQPTVPSMCSANDVIIDLHPVLQSLLGGSIKLELKLEPKVSPIRVVRELLDRAVVNLAINARNAMPEGGALRIETRNVVLDERALWRGAVGTGAHVTIELTDTGPGMDAEARARAFDPIFSTKRDGGAMGLGLTTVYAFAKNSGGYVDVMSEVGRGTTFFLCLPTVEADEYAAGELPAPGGALRPPPSPRLGRTILVVDDDPFIRRMMERILRRERHSVLVASNGPEAIHLATQHDADIGVIILDVLMPGMTGPELGRRLADQCVGAKQLFMSGFAPESLPRVTNAGPEYLQKPFSSVDLLARVQRLLDG